MGAVVVPGQIEQNRGQGWYKKGTRIRGRVYIRTEHTPGACCVPGRINQHRRQALHRKTQNRFQGPTGTVLMMGAEFVPKPFRIRAAFLQGTIDSNWEHILYRK